MHCYDRTSFVVGEAKVVLSLQMSEDHGKEMLVYFCGAKHFHSYEERREGEGEMVKHEKHSQFFHF